MTLANNLFHLPAVDFIFPLLQMLKCLFLLAHLKGLMKEDCRPLQLLMPEGAKIIKYQRRKVSSTLLAADNARSKGDGHFIYIRCFPLTKLFQLHSQFIC